MLEPDATQRAERQLAASMFVFTREQIVGRRLVYYPLYRVRFAAKVKEGWIFTQEIEKRDNLYFSGVTGELLSYTSAGFTFAGPPPTHPMGVVDLDNLASFETRLPGEQAPGLARPAGPSHLTLGTGAPARAPVGRGWDLFIHRLE